MLKPFPPLAVPYEIYRADHSCLITVLPVNASVRDVLRSLAPRLGRDREHILVKVNSAGGEQALPGMPPYTGCHCAMVAIAPCPARIWPLLHPGTNCVFSPTDKVGLQLDAVGVFTALGLNERLFAVSVEELGSLVSMGQGGPRDGQHQAGPPSRVWGCGASIAAQGSGCPSLPAPLPRGRGWCCLPCCGS